MIKKEKILQEEKLWEEEKELIARRAALKQKKRELKSEINSKNKIPTSKLLILFLFLNCTFIEIFTGFITLKSFSIVELTNTSPDFSPLVTIIGAVVSEVIGFAIYALKSTKENTSGGIIYEKAMLETRQLQEEIEDN